MAAKPRREVRGVAEAQCEGNLLQRAVLGNDALTRRMEATPFQKHAQTHAKMLLEDLICPPEAEVRRAMVRPRVVLPHPDSPAMPKVSPGYTSKLT